jgi:hypothetical protein
LITDVVSVAFRGLLERPDEQLLGSIDVEGRADGRAGCRMIDLGNQVTSCVATTVEPPQGNAA